MHFPIASDSTGKILGGLCELSENLDSYNSVSSAVLKHSVTVNDLTTILLISGMLCWSNSFYIFAMGFNSFSSSLMYMR